MGADAASYGASVGLSAVADEYLILPGVRPHVLKGFSEQLWPVIRRQPLPSNNDAKG